ncbi:MAG TPA: zinc-binding dehydrogenase [Dehalococcoidia bacterium]|nr:zinc-binding dehydrogenase [Dehalococcoidia bacterium]
MAETMRAALDDGTGQYIVHDVPMPEMYDGAAMIRVRQTGICGSDLHMTTSRTEAQTMASGHEVAGEILELPKGETNLQVGDCVAVEMIGAGRACLSCHFCRYGQWKHCMNLAPDTGGGFSHYMTRKTAGLFKLTDSMDWIDGGLVEPMAVSVHGLRYGRMQPDDVVGVVGSATIGLSSIVVAKAFGARAVIASARYPHQAEAAKKMGADIVVGSDEGEFEAACLDATNGIGADFVIESVGGHQSLSFKQAIKATRNQGTMLYLGGMKIPLEVDLFEPLIREIRIQSVICYGVIDGRHDYEVAIDLLASGEVPYREIVTHQVGLENIQKGFAAAWDKTSGSIKVHVNI